MWHNSHPIGDVQPSGVTELQGVCVCVYVYVLCFYLVRFNLDRVWDQWRDGLAS